MSTAFLHRGECGQRLQGRENHASRPSGSRRGDPGVLRPRRALTQIIHIRLSDGPPVLEYSRPWPCESKPEAKNAASEDGTLPSFLFHQQRCDRQGAKAGHPLLFFRKRRRC